MWLVKNLLLLLFNLTCTEWMRHQELNDIDENSEIKTISHLGKQWRIALSIRPNSDIVNWTSIMSMSGVAEIVHTGSHLSIKPGRSSAYKKLDPLKTNEWTHIKVNPVSYTHLTLPTIYSV